MGWTERNKKKWPGIRQRLWCYDPLMKTVKLYFAHSSSDKSWFMTELSTNWDGKNRIKEGRWARFTRSWYLLSKMDVVICLRIVHKTIDGLFLSYLQNGTVNQNWDVAIGHAITQVWLHLCIWANLLHISTARKIDVGLCGNFLQIEEQTKI